MNINISNFYSVVLPAAFF